MKRRTWLLTGVGTAAAAAGLGWRLMQGSPEPRDDAFWTLRFPTPEGGELALASMLGRPLLLNFWAPWCAPCVKEMPDIDRFAREHAAHGWQVLGLAVDNPRPVQSFLAKSPVGFPIALAGFDGAELTRRLGNPDGALPFSVVFDREGRIVARKLGATEPALLERWGGKYAAPA